MKIRGQQVYSAGERIERLCVPEPNSGCWLWLGTLRNEYGRLTIGSRSDGSRRTIGAHVFSYLTFVGPLPSGTEVCHRCDNPMCVNPDHLFAGTHQENVDDRQKKGRGTRALGERNGRSKLKIADVIEIRQSAFGCRRLAVSYGVDKTTIQDIRRGRIWKLPDPPNTSGER